MQKAKTDIFLEAIRRLGLWQVLLIETICVRERKQTSCNFIDNYQI
jgi:hypothetical protein